MPKFSLIEILKIVIEAKRFATPQDDGRLIRLMYSADPFQLESCERMLRQYQAHAYDYPPDDQDAAFAAGVLIGRLQVFIELVQALAELARARELAAIDIMAGSLEHRLLLSVDFVKYHPVTALQQLVRRQTGIPITERGVLAACSSLQKKGCVERIVAGGEIRFKLTPTGQRKVQELKGLSPASA